MARNKILIVDDNPTNMKLIRVLLANEGYQVRTAQDAKETRQILKEFTPELILMDIQLPDIDGLELTRQLKSNPATHYITIVGLTAYAMTGDKERIIAAGCDGYISKPINTRTLPDVIAGYLRKPSSLMMTTQPGSPLVLGSGRSVKTRTLKTSRL